MIRRAARSRSASTESSIFRGMALYDVFQWNSRRFATADAVEGALGEVEILKLVKMLEDRFAEIKGLGAPGALGELLQAPFDGFGKTDSQHGTSLYNYAVMRVGRTWWPVTRRGARTSFPGFPLPCAKTGGRRRHPRRGGRS